MFVELSADISHLTHWLCGS